jgi:serine/threonine protein kinase
MKICVKHTLKKRFIGKGKNALTQLESEIEIMNNLNHPNIARLFEVIDSTTKIYLIIEY